jgi:excisionase family DNA binding protein
MTSREPLLTPALAGARCRTCAKTILRAIHAGKLKAYRLGERGAYRIAVEDLETWIEECAVTPAPAGPRRSAAIPPRLAPRELPSIGRLRLTDDMGRHG